MLHIDQLTVRFGAAEVVRAKSRWISTPAKNSPWWANPARQGDGANRAAAEPRSELPGRIELDGVGDVLSLSERALRGVRGAMRR